VAEGSAHPRIPPAKTLNPPGYLLK
jgi:hypothetical protein